ncbi:DUF4328 domain-containing protein [Kitasatospora sp. NPDC001261]|uniref:DUF4328 domain-containing protein n=1 Tax=Kitasatospora sp. NPDC001261 TaxID=3364012 RepID=UPI0036A2CB30
MDRSKQHRAVVGWGAAASLLILAMVAWDVLLAAADWRVYLVVQDALAGKATEAEFTAAADFWDSVRGPRWLLLLVPVYAVFAVWMWRARLNAEALGGPGSQRRARAWALAGWITPVANLWVPYQVVSDVWKASAPERSAPRARLAVWWGALLVGTYVGNGYVNLVKNELDTVDDLRRLVTLSTTSAVLDVVAGVIILHVIHRVSTWQTQRRAEARR